MGGERNAVEIHLPELRDILPQPVRRRRDVRLDDIPVIGLGGCLRVQEEILQLVIDEVGRALEIGLVDIEAGSRPEEVLESGYARQLETLIPVDSL